MLPIAGYTSQTEAEMVRARLADAGIHATVADWSAMREIADYRVLVATDDAPSAAALVGVAPPADLAPLPAWVGPVGIVVGAVVLVLAVIAVVG